MNSFVDFLIINELCKNIDAYRLSTYFQINENKKVVMGPIWDFNFSLGLTDYLSVILVATLASVGTAGVPGVGLIMLTMVLNNRVL